MSANILAGRVVAVSKTHTTVEVVYDHGDWQQYHIRNERALGARVGAGVTIKFNDHPAARNWSIVEGGR